MKTLILYASNHGTTAKICRYIAEKIENSTIDIVNIKSNKPLNLNLYDRIIIGASIHAGSVQRSISNFLKTNQDLLLTKPLALFLCGMNKPEYEQQFEKVFPEILRKHAISNKVVGGEFLLEEMNMIEKAIIKKITGIKETISEIDFTKVDELIEEIKK
ncbi:MAG: flavodoxin domain-containing protein [Bacteroidales bacterium]|nr:flavodoxin domain-containing protein [Bacteroidales bacterium]